MNTSLMIFLRSIHIVAAALWVGAAIMYLFFIKPSVKAIGPAGPQFMQSLTERRRYPMFMISVSLLTVLAGGILYLYTSGGLSWGWVKTGPGLGFTIGALAGLVAFLVGTFGIGPTSAQMGALGQEIGKTGGRPNAEQANKMQGLEKKLSTFEQIDFIMLAIAMLTMVTARFWGF